MMYVWFLRVNVVVCSNEWCLKQKERYFAESHIRSLRFLDITKSPTEEPICFDCIDLCTKHACFDYKLEGYDYCFRCMQERKNVILSSLSKVPPFCPRCGQLCFPDPNYRVNCKNYRCGYVGPLDQKLDNKLKQIWVRNTDKNKIDSHKPNSKELTNKVTFEYQVLENNSKSFGGYFEWPTTETYPTFHGTIIDTSEWPNQSPLNLMGYNVNSKENLSSRSRQEILSFVYASSTLPYVKSKSYMMEWGPANTPARLKKIADNLATHGRKMRRNGYKNPLMKYDDDLAYLKKKYYDGMFIGEWPSTQPYN